MPQENLTEEEANIVKNLVSQIEKEMEAGNNLEQIVNKMTKSDTKKDEVKKMVEPIYNSILEETKSEKYTKKSIIIGLIAAAAAAILGAFLWAIIVILSDREVGYMALGMGALVSLSMLLLTKGKKGLPLQAISIIFSIIGIVIGKYLMMFYLTKELFSKEYGLELSYFDFFNTKFLSTLSKIMGSLVDGYDILWIVLAVTTAYSMLKSKNIDLKKINN